MKKVFNFVVLGLCLCAFSSSLSAKSAATTQTKSTVVVTYKWNRIPTNGSNQVAIWVEDASGKCIRTVFATRFTVKGGFKNRTNSLKTWVEKSAWKDATKDEIDALSSATPSDGIQKVTWDCKDQKGKVVPNGKYTLMMEGNLRNNKMMYAKAVVEIGNQNQKMDAGLSFVPEDGKAEPLFEKVTVEYIK